MDRYDLFVNLHKGCGRRMPVTFRNAVLLNAAKLIVSDRCHPRDEGMYAGLMHFTDLPDIPQHYRALLELNRTEHKLRVYTAFSKRFAPLLLFEEAGILRDWDLQRLL